MDPNLYNAARRGDLGHLQSLTPEQKSELPSQLAPNQNTVLHVATEFRQLEFARAVSRSYPSLLWRQNGVGDTPLHVAARESLVEHVELFVGFGMLGMVNLDGDTALHCAAREGNLGCVDRLVRADPRLCSVVNNSGESPLYLAVTAGYWEVPQVIIDNAPLWASYKGANGLTALHPALFYSNYDIERIRALVLWRREMIREQDALGLTPLHYASLYGRTETIYLFLQNESSAVYILDNNGESALHIAAFRGHIIAMEEILNCRPDSCYLVDKKGRTALHSAVLGDQKQVVKFILQTPTLARPMNKPDRDGNTPLHLATLFKLHGVIKILVEDNVHVNLNFKNKEFLTALDVYNKHEEEGLRPAITRYLLGSSAGTMTMQHLAEEEIKKMNQEIMIEIPPSDLETNKKESPHPEKKNALEVNLLVATLVATVTFAAGRFSMPSGSFNDDTGKTILATKVALHVFVVFNNLAFCCSVFAVLLQFHASLKQRVRYIGIATFFTTIAISAMFIAFAVGLQVVLTRSIRFPQIPYVICGFFALLYIALPFCDPGVEGLPFLRRPQKFVRGIIVREMRFIE